MGDDVDGRAGLPAGNRDQSCAFCGAARPRFAHPLDPARVRFRVYGKGHTLPTFWAACRDCEALVAAGDDAALLRLMGREDADGVAHRAALAAFRAADRGAVPLRDDA